MSKRAKKQEEQENLERWLLTYCDLITLLLAFFVVMYSMSQIDAKKFGSLSVHLRSILTGQLGILKEAPSIAGKSEMGNIAEPQPIDLQIVEGEILKTAEEKDFKKQIALAMDERGLVVHIMDTALFEVGKAYLTPDAQSMLEHLAPELRRLPNPLRIEGHTDNVPIQTPLFPSNWELSVARSTSVVRYLVEKHGISPLRVAAIGYGEYRPIAPNDSPANKAKNRRIDIVILSMKNAGDEPSAAKASPIDEAKAIQEKNSY
jgi:chemotaxis protein MotB